MYKYIVILFLNYRKQSEINNVRWNGSDYKNNRPKRRYRYYLGISRHRFSGDMVELHRKSSVFDRISTSKNEFSEIQL